MPMMEQFQSRYTVSRETIDRLVAYEHLLKKWNPAINLVSKSTLDQVWERHFADSAQVFALKPDDCRSWLDIGSGGGFPGLVVAILAQEKAPELRVALMESDLRKSAFLSTVARELSLAVEVIAARVEETPPHAADVLSARALAALPMLLGFADRHLKQGGTALFLKGARWQDEVAAASSQWLFQCEHHISSTDPQAAVLKIEGIKHV